MALRNHFLRLLLLFGVLHCFALSHAQQFLTNSATYLDTQIFSLNSTNINILGSVSSTAIDNVTQTAILATTNALIRMNIAGDFLNQSNYLARIIQQNMISQFVGPQIDPSSGFVLVGGQEPPASIGLFHLSNLTLVDVGFAVGTRNPITVRALQDILGSVKDSQYAYFASRFVFFLAHILALFLSLLNLLNLFCAFLFPSKLQIFVSTFFLITFFGREMTCTNVSLSRFLITRAREDLPPHPRVLAHLL